MFVFPRVLLHVLEGQVYARYPSKLPAQVTIKNLRALLAMLHIQASATVLMKQFGETHTDGMNFMEFATCATTLLP